MARKAGLGTLGELVAVLKRGNAEALMTAVVEAMMTNESLFFRDKVPFEHFRSAILAGTQRGAPHLAHHPHLVRSRRDRPGALFARHLPQGDGARHRRLAHRYLGDRPLQRSPGEGAGGDLQPVRGATGAADPPPETQSNDMWQLTPNIRGMVKYRQVNLISDFPHLGMFDLIFCRNVLIYFDQQTKVDLLDRLA